jgi:hypothetical protein
MPNRRRLLLFDAQRLEKFRKYRLPGHRLGGGWLHERRPGKLQRPNPRRLQRQIGTGTVSVPPKSSETWGVRSALTSVQAGWATRTWSGGSPCAWNTSPRLGRQALPLAARVPLLGLVRRLASARYDSRRVNGQVGVYSMGRSGPVGPSRCGSRNPREPSQRVATGPP